MRVLRAFACDKLMMQYTTFLNNETPPITDNLTSNPLLEQALILPKPQSLINNLQKILCQKKERSRYIPRIFSR